MTISIIAIIGKKRELGKGNTLLWHIPEDLKRFKALTANHVVVMGRKTFESIGKPLPNRTNIIITRNRNFKASNCTVLNSFEQALETAKKKEKRGEIFIIGGGEIYRQAIGIADKLYLTIVDKNFSFADTFFPNYSEFKKVTFEEKHQREDFSYTFLELIKE